MKLHYSQTTPYKLKETGKVLLPYEITLFSNSKGIENLGSLVLLPYEITLFSNMIKDIMLANSFYYLMKLHYSQTVSRSQSKTA